MSQPYKSDSLLSRNEFLYDIRNVVRSVMEVESDTATQALTQLDVLLEKEPDVYTELRIVDTHVFYRCVYYNGSFFEEIFNYQGKLNRLVLGKISQKIFNKVFEDPTPAVFKQGPVINGTKVGDLNVVDLNGCIVLGKIKGYDNFVKGLFFDIDRDGNSQDSVYLAIYCDGQVENTELGKTLRRDAQRNWIIAPWEMVEYFTYIPDAIDTREQRVSGVKFKIHYDEFMIASVQMTPHRPIPNITPIPRDLSYNPNYGF